MSHVLDRGLARLAPGALSTADALATIALATACVLYTAGAWASAASPVRLRGER